MKLGGAFGGVVLSISIVGILMLAGVLRYAVLDLQYEGNGSCAYLLDASADALQYAMLPVRALLFGWMLATGYWLTRGLYAGGSTPLAVVCGVGAACFAIATQAFVAMGGLLVVFLLPAIWVPTAVVLLGTGVWSFLRRGQQSAVWHYTLMVWMAFVGLLLPVLLLSLTGTGEVDSC